MGNNWDISSCVGPLQRGSISATSWTSSVSIRKSTIEKSRSSLDGFTCKNSHNSRVCTRKISSAINRFRSSFGFNCCEAQAIILKECPTCHAIRICFDHIRFSKESGIGIVISGRYVPFKSKDWLTCQSNDSSRAFSCVSFLRSDTLALYFG